MTSYILVFAAQEIYAACVMIWNVLPPSRPPTVFRFSADQINVFCSLHFFSALAVRRQCIAVLSSWTMRRRSPACHNCYRFVFRLTGYSGARPRRHRLQAYRTRRGFAAPSGRSSETVRVFPRCQADSTLMRHAVPGLSRVSESLLRQEFYRSALVRALRHIGAPRKRRSDDRKDFMPAVP